MKTILITGASSGIGAACAKRLAAPGVRLVLCSRNIQRLESMKKSLQGRGAKVFAHEIDIRSRASTEAMFANLEKEGFSIDFLINSAGLALDLADIEDGNPEDWSVMIDTNVKGLLYVTGLSIKQMAKKNFGHIINIGSIAATYPYPGGVVYAATKSAVKFISDGLRKEVANKNIKVTNVQPGLVETNFSNIRFKGDREKARNVYKGIKPLRAGDIAEAVEYVMHTPRHVQICEITITPLHQAAVDVIYRH